MRKVRENILVASGDQSVFAADTAVYVCGDQGEITVNGLRDGQLVFYDFDTGTSLGPGVGIGTVDRLVIGVGVDTNGDGVADVIRKPFGESIFGCDITAATAKAPACGVKKIVDMFPKCVHCEEEFTINITVEDDVTQNQYPYNRPSQYTFTVKTDCCECDSCDDGIDCNLLICKFVDQINNQVGSTDATQQSVFTKLARRKPELPFHAVRLFGGFATASLDYCLNPVVGACDECINIEGISGVSFTPVGGQDPVVVNFTNVADPADATLSLQSQIPGIVRQINDALDGNGSAIVTSSLEGTARPCCPYLLQVNTCFTDFELLDDEGVAIDPCNESDPFAAITLTSTCLDCTEGTSTETPTCGIRIISKPVDIDCNCEFPPDTPRGYLGRNIEVYPSAGFACGATIVQTVQAEQLPMGLGYEWKWREAASDNGGHGRSHNPWGYDPHGAYGLPLKSRNGRADSRAYSAKSVCKEQYCSYAIEHNLPNSDIGVHGRQTAARGRTIVLIPSGDAVTRAEFEAILNPYLTSSQCPIKASVTCGGEVDIEVQ